MKSLIGIIISLFFLGCSFDNKTGIWKNENISNEDINNIEELVELNKIFEDTSFKSTIKLDKNFKFNLSKPVDNYSWNNIFYKNTNNLDNFKYIQQDKEIYKSKKLSRKENNGFILFNNGYFIFNDSTGNIIFFSLKEKKIVNKFNFYKKNYKKNINKKLNLFINNDLLYVSDNFGFLYSYDIKLKKILWAKNYKIPFRSNLKIQNNKIYTSNQNNDFLVINRKNGEILKRIPTEESNIQSKFINNIASDNQSTIFFLNSYGSLHSIDANYLQVRWFINLNRSLDLNPLNIFSGKSIVYYNKKIIVSTSSNTYIIDSVSGSILSKLNFSSLVRPIIHNNYLFLINKNNFLISYNLVSKEILYSYSIDEQIAESLKIKKKKVSLKDLMLVNNNLLISLNNSYLLYFDISGKLKEIKKLNSPMSSKSIFIDKSLIYLDKKNRLRILN